MKRILAISLISIYLLASIGVAGNLHFCQGELESIELIVVKEHKCCKQMAEVHHCGMMPVEEPQKGCCDDEPFFAQIDSEHFLSSKQEQFSISLDKLSNYLPNFDHSVLFSKSGNEVDPPIYPPPQRDIYLINCSLIFYG